MARRAAWTAAGALGLAGLAAWLTGPEPGRLAQPPSTVVSWEDGHAAHVFLSPDEKWRIAADLDHVDPDYVEALVAVEDARFWWHPGVDPLAVGRAALGNLAAGRVVSGASTLTMQVARLAEGRPRTVAAKAAEAAEALRLELRLSKREILERYLTFTPYGRNIEGVEAASWWYFGHDAADLSPAEIATLIAVPQDPVDRFPSPGHAERLRAARDGVARRLWAERDPARLAAATGAPVPTSVAAPPREAAHAARWLRERAPGRRALPTTLRRGEQRVVERIVARHAEVAARLGVRDVAVVVAEQETGRVVALVGGADPHGDWPGAQIAAFDEPRSPGSTLKPLLYAAALDAGLVLPDTLVADVPVRHGAYSPQNYDHDWAGAVRMEDALSRSLNVPFVELLGRFGVERMLGLLRTGGVRSVGDEPGRYGLSLAVGGVELTPLELTGLYQALARDGTARPLTLDPAAPGADGIPLVSPGAAWLTRRSLRLRDRPDFPARASLSQLPQGVAWKTGTSFGNHDAWAVGSGARYTVTTWFGNLDRRPSTHLVGAELAAPLLFDLLDGLHDGRGAEDPPPPDLAPMKACALSGAVPGPACPETRLVPALAARAPAERCPFHVQAEVDVETGLRLTRGCADTHRRVTRSFVAWPPAVDRQLQGRLGDAPPLPPLSPDCAAPATGGPPRVVSPRAGEVAVLLPGLDPTRQQVPLEADAAAGSRLSWFVDGAFVGSAPAGDRVWWTPAPGAHRVLVQDDAGRSAEGTLEVRGG